jgi:dGTPase
LAEVRWWQRASEGAGVDPHEPFTDIERHRVVRHLIGLMVGDLLAETSARVDCMCEAGGNDADAVRKWSMPLVGFTEESITLNGELKAWLFEHLYSHPRVMRMTNKGDRVLRDLFRAYVEEPRMLGEGTRRQLARLPLERVVCDYIAGMTDRFALDEHARLFDPHERV